tara:strand:- start:16036 stop:16806 length:771 start_codon:yes stop_codon:yes gene_type:complete
MNFFFGLNHDDIKSKISIPKFKSSGEYNSKIKLFSAEIQNDNWMIKSEISEETSNFFNINENEINNRKIFFIAKENEVESYYNNNRNILENINNFTDTAPSYRCNLKVFKKGYGYSSYQSDYPYKMTNKNGSVLSSIFLLTNKIADKNYILFRNIFFKPVEEYFDFYIVDINEKKIIFNQKIKSNYSNLIEINKEFINENYYFFTKKYIGIPVYLSILEGHLSFEHTHPPHTYILSNNKYELVRNLKKQINEIIHQ